MKTSTFPKRGLVVAALLSLTVVVPLEAQRGSPRERRGQGGNRAQLEQAVRARMADMMQQSLGLTEEEGARLSETVEEFEDPRQQVERQERALRRRTEALMLEGADDQTEATELLQRMSELRLEEIDLFRAEQDALLEILTPVQVLRLLQMREQLGQRIQRLRGQSGRGGGRGDGRRGGIGRGNGRGGDIGPGGGRSGLFRSGQARPRPGGSHVLRPAGS
jgi:hypothetical protein